MPLFTTALCNEQAATSINAPQALRLHLMLDLEFINFSDFFCRTAIQENEVFTRLLLQVFVSRSGGWWHYGVDGLSHDPNSRAMLLDVKSFWYSVEELRPQIPRVPLPISWTTLAIPAIQSPIAADFDVRMHPSISFPVGRNMPNPHASNSMDCFSYVVFCAACFSIKPR